MATSIGGLFIDLVAQTAGWKRDLDRAAGQVRSTRSKVNRSLAAIDRQFARARRSVARFAKSALSLRSVVGTLVGGAGLGLLIKKSSDFADVIAKTADAAGISTKAFQEYRFAAGLSGVATEQFDKALIQIGKRIGELRTRTDSELITALKNFDKELLDNIRNARSQEEALDLVFRKMGTLTDQTKRIALATAVFGRSGALMTNLVRGGARALDEMRAQANRLGLVIDERLLRQAETLKDRMSILGQVLRVSVTKAILENAAAIQSLVDAVIRAIPRITRFIDQLARLAGFGTILGGAAKLKADLAAVNSLLAEMSKGRSILGGRKIAVLLDPLPTETQSKILESLGLPPDARTVGTLARGRFQQVRDILKSEAARIRAELQAQALAASGFNELGLPDAGAPPSAGIATTLTDKAKKALARQREAARRALDQITADWLRATDQQEALIARRRDAAIAALGKIKATEAEVAQARLRINDTFDAQLAELRNRRLEDSRRKAQEEMALIRDAGESVGLALEDSFVIASQRSQNAAERLRRVWLSVLEDIQRQLIRLSLFGKSGTGGLIGSVINGLVGSFGSSINVGSAPAQGGGTFQHGGSFMVGGRSGTDANFVGFQASKGERVTVETAAQQRAGRSGDTFIVDMRGASLEAVARLEAFVMEMNANLDRRSVAATNEARFRLDRSAAALAR